MPSKRARWLSLNSGVRDLQQQILEALSGGAPDAEIERLLAELRNAMDDYMRALSNRLRSDPGELFDPTEALKAVGSRELTDLVDRISELVRTGSRQQARTLLTRLQEIMESISVGNLSDLSGSSSAEAVEMIQTIRQIISEQQQLLDESFRILRDVGEEDVDTTEQAVRQADVRDVLESFMERMEEFGYDVPRHYSRANPLDAPRRPPAEGQPSGSCGRSPDRGRRFPQGRRRRHDGANSRSPRGECGR